MSFLQRLLGQSSSLSLDEERFWAESASITTTSGERVSADTALKISAAWACGRLISESVAMLPAIVYERLKDGGKERAGGHPVYNILHDQPNRKQTAFEFMDMMQMHALNRGNAYAKIVGGGRGPVDKLIPIHPDRVRTEDIDEETVRYIVTERNGQEKTYLDDEILHLRGLTLDGTNGVSVITYARETMGLAMAAEKYGSRLFRNGARPGGALRHPGHLSEAAQDRLRNQVEGMTAGENQHRLMVLEEGMEYEKISFTPEDSQMLQTREFQAEEVCRWYKVPPVMVGLTSKSTSWGSGIAELSQGFVTYTLMPWLVRWQQVFSKDLILASEKYFVEFLTEALLRGDIEKRYKAYAVGRNWGWLATNEIRKAENMNPRKDGDDDYLTPKNMSWDGEEPDPNLGLPAKKKKIPPPGLEEDPEDPKREQARAHHLRLVRESAGRVARKEAAALSKVAGDYGDAWLSAADKFFEKHADFVSQAMCVSTETAQSYSEMGVSRVHTLGRAGLERWEPVRAKVLTALTMADAEYVETEES